MGTAPKPVPALEGRDTITWVWDRDSALCPPKGHFKAGGVQRINVAVKKSRELWSQQRCASAMPRAIAGLQGLNSPQSSEGLQVRAPHLESHGTALSATLGCLLWTWAGGGSPNSVFSSREFKDIPQAFSKTFWGGGKQGGQLIPRKSQIPSDSLNRASQGPQDLQELRASRAFVATLAPLGHRGTEGLQGCLGCQDRR